MFNPAYRDQLGFPIGLYIIFVWNVLVYFGSDVTGIQDVIHTWKSNDDTVVGKIVKIDWGPEIFTVIIWHLCRALCPESFWPNLFSKGHKNE